MKDPTEARERAVERLSEWREKQKPRYRYETSPIWERKLHELLGAVWPCPSHSEFVALWGDVRMTMAEQGLRIGRGAYGGWDDADPALARAVWCAALHSHAKTVVETGVARGITSYFILEALERNGAGHLWSIDIPPLAEPILREETAVAVPDRLRHRWTYLEGSSRTRLPGLLNELRSVDLFVHDSMHTKRNVDFELGAIWPALRRGGMAIADDVERNTSFAEYSARHPDGRFVLGMADDCQALLGIAQQPVGVTSGWDLSTAKPRHKRRCRTPG